MVRAYLEATCSGLCWSNIWKTLDVTFLKKRNWQLLAWKVIWNRRQITLLMKIYGTVWFIDSITKYILLFSLLCRFTWHPSYIKIIYNCRNQTFGILITQYAQSDLAWIFHQYSLKIVYTLNWDADKCKVVIIRPFSSRTKICGHASINCDQSP